MLTFFVNLGLLVLLVRGHACSRETKLRTEAFNGQQSGFGKHLLAAMTVDDGITYWASTSSSHDMLQYG